MSDRVLQVGEVENQMDVSETNHWARSLIEENPFLYDLTIKIRRNGAPPNYNVEHAKSFDYSAEIVLKTSWMDRTEVKHVLTERTLPRLTRLITEKLEEFKRGSLFANPPQSSR